MITLERVRLVNWHNFDDTVINIGNRCLISGDNGSGKSTIIDAIQYTMAADLRKARFNAAAGDRKGGRDLAGYVRCKLGSDATEYLRGDTAAHIMLEFSAPASNAVTAGGAAETPVRTGASGGWGADTFTAGVCVEAYTDGGVAEHFWMGGDIPVDGVAVYNGASGGILLNFRQFKDLLDERGVTFYESKKLYLRDFTARLGVWKRFAEYNPYLEMFTRSINFTPLVSVDRFVCDYILEERPVEITTMKDNLESYKEAERQAEGAIRRIDILKKITAAAAEWRRSEGFILKQEFLKLKIEQGAEKDRLAALNQELSRDRENAAFYTREIETIEKQIFEWEAERQETIASLATNDAHNLYRRTEERIGRLKLELSEAEARRETYTLLRSQCEALLGHALTGSTEEDIAAAEDEERKFRAVKDEAARLAAETTEKLRDVLSELDDLEKGKARYPDYTEKLREALREAGVEALVLADAANVTDEAWADAIEGWLNTRRFALLVEPDQFQQALEIYDSLPRNVGGALLPNLAKMRGTDIKKNSLAELVETDSVYARIYIDFTLGDVIRADIENLKRFNTAVTKECMTYRGHTASRIREETYRRRYLGQAARRKWIASLTEEAGRLRKTAADATARQAEASKHEEIFHRAARTIGELGYLLPAVEAAQRLAAELAESERELAAVDTSDFRELEEKQKSLTLRIKEAENRSKDSIDRRGRYSKSVETLTAAVETAAQTLEEKERAVSVFSENHILEMAECEKYANDKIAKSGAGDLLANYEAALKNYRTRAENQRKIYQNLAHNYDKDFNALLSLEPEQCAEAERIMRRLETSELPEYREKIALARRDAEREFKEHFISKLNEHIGEAHENFHEINAILKTLSFGRDQYRFDLKER
ncbi:MAG: AAA family ATPase, partial [Spirochaetaceae bacterium]|nr:AAA family ATPase [Spirochaetaceae bacterium]